MSNYFHNYIAVQSLVKGKKTTLYFLRFIFQIHRSIPTLLKIAVVSFRFFNAVYTACYSIIDLHFWLLVLNHFVVFYQTIYIIRLLTDYFSINLHQSNKFLKTIFYFSEPYNKVVQFIFPKGIFGSILGFYLIWGFLPFLIKKVSWIVLRYQSSSNNLLKVNLLLRATFDEKIVFN